VRTLCDPMAHHGVHVEHDGLPVVLDVLAGSPYVSQLRAPRLVLVPRVLTSIVAAEWV